jgi:hypothetical protein
VREELVHPGNLSNPAVLGRSSGVPGLDNSPGWDRLSAERVTTKNGGGKATMTHVRTRIRDSLESGDDHGDRLRRRSREAPEADRDRVEEES